MAIFMVQNGFGRNTIYLTPIQIQHWGLHVDISMMLFTIGTGSTRISVCLFVLRLVPATKTFYRRWIWGLLTLFTIITIADFLAQCFQCIPLPGLWDKSVKARCFPESHMTQIAKVQGGSAVITDLLCVLLPVLLLQNIQISLRDKVAILVIIGLGIVTAATACVRTALVDFHTKNPTWDLIPTAIVACLEQNIGITVASMPALRQLLVMHRQRFSSQSIQPLYLHSDNNPANRPRPPLNHFAKLPSSNQIQSTDPNPFTEPNSHEFSTLSPNTPDIEKCDQINGYEGAARASLSLTRMSMVSPPLWTDRKISSASRVEISRVCPQPTFVHRKPSSSAEAVRLSMMAPSWGTHRKTSSADKVYQPGHHIRKLSIASPSSVDRPPSLFAAAAARTPQTLVGRFEETGLRHSRVATPEEIMTLGNPASLGYSCMIEGGTPKTSPEPTP
ncbi:hypothetical protein BDR22DRAFT_845379 [Usnea florida]